MRAFPILLLLFAGIVAGQSAPKLIGELSTLAHSVSGSVYAIDDRTLEIRDFKYDGTGPAAFFWVGKGPVSAAGFKVPVIPSCDDTKLPEYSGQTVQVELPNGQKIADIDYLSIWCEIADANFGNVQIGAALKEGIEASSGPGRCGSGSEPPSAGNSNPAQPGPANVESGGESSGESMTASEPSAGARTNNTAKAAVCVETAWLVKRGHEHGIARRFGKSLAYCIDGLPCGTSGHLLRHCNKGACDLVSYAELCAHPKTSCTVKSVEVSRLRHDYDWSAVRIAGSNMDQFLELTSVSQNPNANLFSVSRIVAIAADNLNKRGLGSALDAVTSLAESANIMFKSSFLSFST